MSNDKLLAVLANAYAVPQILGHDGKQKAVAIA
jgi:hypothetical protein